MWRHLQFKDKLLKNTAFGFDLLLNFQWFSDQFSHLLSLLLQKCPFFAVPCSDYLYDVEPSKRLAPHHELPTTMVFLIFNLFSSMFRRADTSEQILQYIYIYIYIYI